MVGAENRFTQVVALSQAELDWWEEARSRILDAGFSVAWAVHDNEECVDVYERHTSGGGVLLLGSVNRRLEFEASPNILPSCGREVAGLVARALAPMMRTEHIPWREFFPCRH